MSYKWNALKYTLPLLVYISIYRSFAQSGWQIFLPLAISFLLIPLLELTIKPNPANLTAAEEALSKDDPIFDWIVYAIVPLQYAALGLYLARQAQTDLTWWQHLGHALVMGLACGSFGINVGHELGHRHKPAEQWMAKALLLTSLYTHFFIEHNKGHHKHVATEQDPSSAPYRMSLYRFWLRSISGVYADAWRIAIAEQKKKGQSWWQNEMLQLQVLQLVFILFILAIFGAKVLLFFIASAGIGILLLETVNYIEHYGLRRRHTSAHGYERAMPEHSWNSNHVLGRMVLFELSRHSDHHYLASRKYQVLRSHDNAPQLPTGYPGSMLLATFPPLWFRIMDKQMRKYKLPIPQE